MLDQFLNTVRRRHLINLTLEYITIATGVGATGVLLLLLLGTQILNWYWVALLFVCSLGTGMFRARRQRLSRYRVAQVADARLGLHDRLSTVIWFHEHGQEAAEAIDTVERQAMERLRPGDAARAMPVRAPRYAYACLALLLASGGLLGLRYGMLRTLDLSAPIASIDLGMFLPETKVQAAAKKSAIQERYEQQLKELGLDPVDMGGDERALQPIESEVPATGEQGTQVPDPEGKHKGKSASEAGEQGEGGEESQGDTAENADAQTGQEGQQGEQGQKGNSQQQQAPQNAKNGQSGSENGLMNKMRDALANMLNKLKSQPQGSEQQMASSQQPQQQQGQKGQNQQGMQSKSKSQGEGSQSQEQSGDQESGEKMAGDKSKSGDQNSDKPGSENSKSGMGQSDGEKDIRAAEQLAAMGKISEIFGRRAQQVSGEITVEVASGKQQLKTAWSERKALHSDTGAETNRDEIPLAYQTYIQRYFEAVRKAASKPAKSGS